MLHQLGEREGGGGGKGVRKSEQIVALFWACSVHVRGLLTKEQASNIHATCVYIYVYGTECTPPNIHACSTHTQSMCQSKFTMSIRLVTFH